jgi:threonine dehydratase
VEPIGAPKLHRSLAAGEVVRLDRTGSIADGLITLNVGAIPFAEISKQRDRIRGVALVEDESIRAAVQFLWRTCELAVEPSGAATVAALQDGLVPRSRTTVLVVSGGNVDPSLLEATD